MLALVTSDKGHYRPDFLKQLEGEVGVVGTHTACLSCVGVFAQLHCWAPQIQLKIAYVDWSEWRSDLIEFSEGVCFPDENQGILSPDIDHIGNRIEVRMLNGIGHAN